MHTHHLSYSHESNPTFSVDATQSFELPLFLLHHNIIELLYVYRVPKVRVVVTLAIVVLLDTSTHTCTEPRTYTYGTHVCIQPDQARIRNNVTSHLANDYNTHGIKAFVENA